MQYGDRVRVRVAPFTGATGVISAYTDGEDRFDVEVAIETGFWEGSELAFCYSELELIEEAIQVGRMVKLHNLAGSRWVTRWDGFLATVTDVNGPLIGVKVKHKGTTATITVGIDNVSVINNAELWV